MGGLCDFSVSPSPFGLDFGTLDLGLTIHKLNDYFFMAPTVDQGVAISKLLSVKLKS